MGWVYTLPRKVPQMTRKRPLTKGEMEHLYLREGLTVAQISEEAGVPLTTLGRWKTEWGIPTCKQAPSLIGQRFGSWLVLEEIPGGRRGIPTQCRCRCDCGTEKLVAAGNLRHGLTHSCGCLRAPDLCGQVFNRLTVLEKVERVNKNGKTMTHYRCLCSCGNETTVYCTSLIRGTIKSCGCLRAPTIPNGTVFGRLTVQAKIRKNGKWVYRCKCSCGGANDVPGTTLKRGMTQSCGCLQGAPLPKGKAAFNAVLYGIKKNARTHNRPFTLTDQEAKTLLQSPCYYCGAPPSRIWKTKCRTGTFRHNGIDRVDNSKGYISGNVVSACWECNRAKYTSTEKEFLKWVHRIKDRPFTVADVGGSLSVGERHALGKYKDSARQRGLPFLLSVGQAKNLFQTNCSYCGQPPSNGQPGRRYTGIDRMDNRRGYSPDNCRPACIRCNRAKHKRSVQEFLVWVKRFQEYQKSSSTR